MGEETEKLCADCKYGATYNEICNTCLGGIIDNPKGWRDAYWQPRETEENKPKEKVRFNFTKGISNKKEDN